MSPLSFHCLPFTRKYTIFVYQLIYMQLYIYPRQWLNVYSDWNRWCLSLYSQSKTYVYFIFIHNKYIYVNFIFIILKSNYNRDTHIHKLSISYVACILQFVFHLLTLNTSHIRTHIQSIGWFSYLVFRIYNIQLIVNIW